MSLQGIEKNKMILIANSQVVRKYRNLLDSFKRLYDIGFPDEDEREDFELILERVCQESEVPRSLILLCSDIGMKKPLGGLVVDWYRAIGALHLTYIIVDKNVRNQGIAKELLTNGIKKIINHLDFPHFSSRLKTA